MAGETFEIIRNAPPPPGRETRGRKTPHPGFDQRRSYPWSELRVGDAFDVPITSVAHDNMRYPEYNRLSAAAATQNKKRFGPKFLVRMLPDEFKVRCWRVA